MGKLINYLKRDFTKDRKLILFLWLILLMGLIFGAFFITILDEHDKLTVSNYITNFFGQIKNNKLDYEMALRNCLTSNLIYILIIWLLGISIIGIPVIILLVFCKGYIIGFSIAAIIANYKFIGLLGAFTYIFPHIIIMSIVIILISCYALSISTNLLRALIKRREINFKNIINRYCLVMLFGIIITVIVSIIEVYISPYLIKIFLFFIKL
ncbi:MAG: stage II sporulation protein M [Bacilli bacterium]|jgi:stage II sporulation protein M|nr:stage II sporulation protein M [Bacilli bacterium]